MIRAEDLIIEDAVSPNILKELRDGGRGLARIIRSASADIGSARAPHGMRSPYWNFITVAKQGGDFQTITEALIAIEDNSAINRYCIFFYPNRSDEQVVMKEYVALVGLDRDVCIIQSSDYQYLVTMADHSSLNEIQVRNLASFGSAVYINEVSDVLIDSCIMEAEGNSEGIARAIHILSSGTIRILGSEIEALNLNAGGWTYGIDCRSTNVGVLDVLIENCPKIEIPSTCASMGIAVFLASADYAATLRLLHSHLMVDNSSITHYGLRIDAPAVDADAYVEHTTIRHASEEAAGVDLYIDGSHAIAYVRADRYSTWSATNSGQIIPLAGDRPRTAQVMTDVPFTITAGAGVWQNVTNMSVTIDLPCESELYVTWGGAWYSDTPRNTAFKTRILMDGAVGSWVSATVGCIAADRRHQYAGRYIFQNVSAGVHTLQLQASRVNAGDAVLVDKSRMIISSVPWP